MIEASASSVETKTIKKPFVKSNSIAADIKHFFLNKSDIKTLIELNSKSERARYNQLIFDRTGFEVDSYKMLNIHQIGIDVPVDFLFNELMNWSSDSSWWPNHLAKVHVLDDDLSRIEVFLFGKINLKPGKNKKSPEFHFLRLFNLSILRKEQNQEAGSDLNSHYLFYKCSGGYPIGVFSLFARNSLTANNESGKSQLFMMVSFNFYGMKSWSKIKFITWPWEFIHNRVASNSLVRVKDYCEQKYQQGKK